jgi:hypothetical protein
VLSARKIDEEDAAVNKNNVKTSNKKNKKEEKAEKPKNVIPDSVPVPVADDSDVGAGSNEFTGWLVRVRVRIKGDLDIS